jgi:hypothetical protein
MDIDTTATNLTSFVSCSLTDTDFIYEGTAPNGYSYGNSTIYGILESTGNITFDSNVTITVYLKVEKD